MGRTYSAMDIESARRWQADIREQHRRAVYDVIRAAGALGITRANAANATGLNPTTVGRRIEELMSPDDKRIHIVDWPRLLTGGHLVPAYAIGAGPDAEMPERRKAERKPRCREEENAEAEAWADIERKHKAWAKTWTPHCDPAAAWMTGSAA